VVVNDSYRLAPWAAVHVALDEDWWCVHGRHVRETFKGESFCVEPSVRDRFGATYLKPVIRDGFSKDWNSPSYGADSGQFAIQLAILKGARRIYLLGYDMGSSPEGKRHWFGDHPKPLRNSSPYDLFLEKYAKAALWCAENGVEVINCSRVSRLECFPRARLEDVL
jgi:hypothetical protein